MKKLLCAIAIAIAAVTASFAVPVAYNETSEKNWSELSCIQVPIYKILDSKEAYIIIYAKNKVGVGKTVIPKKWNKSSPENPRKLQIRELKAGKVKPFMTVIKKSGEFHKVILTIPVDKKNSTWGVVDYHKKVEGSDKDTLEEIEL